MEALIVGGGRELSGRVQAEGAKNAALPACVASLMTSEPVILHRVPQLRDVSTILYTIGALGKRVVRNGTSVVISGDGPLSSEANAYSVQQMRASFLVLAPLVARLGLATVPLPGGCAIGNRPIDLHLRGLEALGARVETHAGAVRVTADGLRGARIVLPFPSVGATEQMLMAAAVAHGASEIGNGAIEPEVLDLADLLRKMGARIDRDGRTYRIEGRTELTGAEHTMIPDRMEAATYLLAGAITGGEVCVDELVVEHMAPFLEALSETGLTIVEEGESIAIRQGGARRPICIETSPHPGFPTDMHPPLAAYLSLVPGSSAIAEAVFESRFAYARYLCEMGAQIAIDGETATIHGVKALRGCEVEATDIRAGAALVLAGLAARGYTSITGLPHIDRGYAHLEGKLQELGASVERRNI